MGDIFPQNQILEILGKSLQGTSLRHRVLSNNIANVDTPQFKRSDVDFNQTLKRIIGEKNKSDLQISPVKTHSKHLSIKETSQITFPVIKDFTSSYRKDGNNVDIEREMVEINKNSLMYNSIVNLLNNEFFILRYAIEEGRR
ncbi:MAG: flagellar basal body rod protein FlgB [Candidatus Omnitrophica bacterium]|nr:flagellar basal body rod protein FlgB [Candidatus Omnitrophota bacterium]